MKPYETELEGQRDFYAKFQIDADLAHHTDGVWRGNLFEHKLRIDNTNKVLFQAIKYASRIRERGEPLPANLVLNDLNKRVAYLYFSKDFLPEIERVYFGAASKDNEAFTTDVKALVIDYGSFDGQGELRSHIQKNEAVPYHIDHTNILGLAEQFYRLSADKKDKALKDRFLDGARAEIRRPTVLADRVLPYTPAGNEAFADIMDSLNPDALQRELGAYYTPTAYVRKMHDMLFKAIAEVPAGMDYLIVDRCAGVGNLEQGLPDDILAHCVLSTLEPNEYQLLRYKFVDQCAVVVPHTDALAYDIIPASVEAGTGKVFSDYVREKVQDPNCVIILMENPPFSEAGSGGTQNSGAKENRWKKSFIHESMKRVKKGAVLNDLANLFIWSGFTHYLTKPTDSYLLYSPTKYWRNQRLVERKFMDGFLCNRKEFHAVQGSAMGCIWWKNQPDTQTNLLRLPAYDIVEDQVSLAVPHAITLTRAFKKLSEAYDSRSFPEDTQDGVLCESSGAEFQDNGRQKRLAPLFNENMIGYVVADSFLIDRKHVELIRTGLYRGNGFYLRADNFSEKLPLFVAATFPYDTWWKTDVYSKSYDGEGSFVSDRAFLKKCLFYTALTPKNKCRSFLGSDARFYRNELCLDADTLASRALDAFVAEGQALSEEEETVLKYWRDVQFEAKKTPEYKAFKKRHPQGTLGLWQIQEEVNIKIDTGETDKQGRPVLRRKHASLNTEIVKLDRALKAYFQCALVPDLFRHQLIK